MILQWIGLINDPIKESVHSAYPKRNCRDDQYNVAFRARESGAIAQLGERYNGIVEVGGSIPPGSTILKFPHNGLYALMLSIVRLVLVLSFTRTCRGTKMAESRSHKTTANRIAQKYGSNYNSGEGADIKAQHITIEVETPESVADAGRQLRGHKGPVYVAGTNKEATEKALELYDNSTIGVMDNQGKIIKQSTRK